MGRELKRVALDFEWPLDKVWQGYLNPHRGYYECPDCSGTGSSPYAKTLHDRWYGRTPFDPTETGSTPYTSDHPIVRALAERAIERSPGYFGTGETAIKWEAMRLAKLLNSRWCHHLSNDDVQALVDGDRLFDFTRTWTREGGWQKNVPLVIPSAQEVNDWSIRGFGHDGTNSYVCIKAACDRAGEPHFCALCEGEGQLWESDEAKDLHEGWEPEEPPVGDGWQMWETVSDGSPICPVFATPEGLAGHLAGRKWGADHGTSYDTWMRMIVGDGWAPSMMGYAGQLKNGVEAIYGEDGNAPADPLE
jgi:hypothetical protein